MNGTSNITTFRSFFSGYGRPWWRGDIHWLHTDGGLFAGKGFIFGIPYTDSLKNTDKVMHAIGKKNAKSEEAANALDADMVSLIYWRHLEARPLWTRLPRFLYDWLYERFARHFSLS